MPEPTGGFIEGETDAMFNYRPHGPDPAALGRQQPLSSALIDGGPELITADGRATEALTVFVTSANTAFEALVRRARAAGEEYLSAESASTASLDSVIDLNPVG